LTALDPVVPGLPLWHAAGNSSATVTATPAASRLITVLLLLFVRGYATLTTSA
jgi:hypothetical protein